MNLQEAYEQARMMCSKQRQYYTLDRESNLDEPGCNQIENLIIPNYYNGEIPDLKKFPCLRNLLCTRPLSIEYVEQQDWSQIERLYLTIEHAPCHIRFIAPNLKELAIHILNNDIDQLDLFTQGKHIIDLRSCKQLQKISLKHFTDYELSVDSEMPTLEAFTCFDTLNISFDFISRFSNLTSLALASCDLVNLSFLRHFPNLSYLDLNRNSICDASAIKQLTRLTKVNLFGNPLTDTTFFGELPNTKIIYTSRDRRLDNFSSSLLTDLASAYRAVLNSDKPDYSRGWLLQHAIDTLPEQEVFAIYFARFVKRTISYNASPDYLFSSTRISKKELEQYATKEYPFLAEYLS